MLLPVVPLIDPSIVSIKKLVFQPCTHFRYVARKYVDDKSEKGRIFAPEVNSLIPVNDLRASRESHGPFLYHLLLHDDVEVGLHTHYKLTTWVTCALSINLSR